MEHVTTDLPDLLLGTVSAADRQRIEQHLSECPSCREEWDAISILRGSFRKDANETLPTGYFSTLSARILERRASGVRAKWIALIRPAVQYYLAPVAAGILIVLALLSVSLDVPEQERVATLPVEPADAVEYMSDNDALFVLDPSASQMNYVNDATLASQDLNSLLTPGLEDLDSQSVRDFVAGLSDAEVDRLIEQLNKRSIL